MFLFGARSKFKQVPGGHAVERRCDECQTVRTFVECDVTDKLHLFFVEVAQGTQRRWVCTECGEDVEPEAAPERPRVEAPAKKPISEREKDEMLAALKRKMRS